MKTFKHIGSVSHGTLRPEDLIPVFLDTLRTLSDSAEEFFKKYVVNDDQLEHGELYMCINGDLFLNEEIGEVVDALIDRLGELALPFFYFGVHPGDGSDFGFWFDDEAFER